MSISSHFDFHFRAGKAAEDVQVVEIWRAGALHRAFNLKVALTFETQTNLLHFVSYCFLYYKRTAFPLQEVDAHGKIYTDGEFGCLKLSEDLGRYSQQNKKLSFRSKFVHDTF